MKDDTVMEIHSGEAAAEEGSRLRLSDAEEIRQVRLNQGQLLRGLAKLALLLASLIAIMISPDGTSIYEESLRGGAAFFSLLRDELGEVGMGQILAVGALAWLYHRELLCGKEKPFSSSACIVSVILSIFLVLGISFSAYGNFDFIGYSVAQFVIAGIAFAGFWGILYTLLKMFYAWLDTLTIQKRSYVGILKKLDEHFLAVCVVVLLACWLVQGLPFFPGTIPHDARNQLNQFYGFSWLNNHHPFASTVLVGIVYSIGRKLFGIMGGCFLYVLFQSVCASFVFGNICSYIRRKTGLLGAGLTALVFFAIVPVFWAYLWTLQKDGVYFITFAWFGLEYVKLLWHDGGRFGMFRLILSAVFICVLRNEGGYIVIPALVVLVLLCADKRRLCVLALAIVMVWNYGWNTLLIDSLGIQDERKQVESISLFLQMVARYDLYYGEELTEEDKAAINAVITYEGLGERYVPELSDAVKNQGYRDTSEEEWEEFWQLWLKLLKRHPVVYAEAVMNEIFGYLDPFYYYTGSVTYQFYNKGSITSTDTDIVYSEFLFPSSVQTAASDAVYTWNKIPILSLLVCPGTYTWLGIILIGALLRKRDYKGALSFITPFMVVLVCFASPVNGYMRYTLPIIAGMPMYFLVGLRPYWQRSQNCLSEAGEDAVR